MAKRLPQSELQDRINRDEGSPEDTVFVTKLRHRTTYHENRECRQIRTRVGESSRESAQERELGPCKVCVLGGGEGFSPGGYSKLEQLIQSGEADHLMEDAR